jgi:hypothetical protein
LESKGCRIAEKAAGKDVVGNEDRTFETPSASMWYVLFTLVSHIDETQNEDTGSRRHNQEILKTVAVANGTAVCSI